MGLLERTARVSISGGDGMKKCAKCDFEYDDEYDGCPRCAREAENQAAPGARSINMPMATGLAGATLLFVGVFLPIVSLPVVGSVNYFNNGQGDGAILVGLAFVSVLLVIVKRYRGLLATGVLSLLLLAYSFWALTQHLAQAKTSMNASLAGNPFAGLAQAAIQSVQIQWGWAVLVVGAVLLLAAGVMRIYADAPDGHPDMRPYFAILAAIVVIAGLGLMGLQAKQNADLKGLQAKQNADLKAAQHKARSEELRWLYEQVAALDAAVTVGVDVHEFDTNVTGVEAAVEAYAPPDAETQAVAADLAKAMTYYRQAEDYWTEEDEPDESKMSEYWLKARDWVGSAKFKLEGYEAK